LSACAYSTEFIGSMLADDPCPSESIVAAGHWYFRCSRAARGFEDRRSKFRGQCRIQDAESDPLTFTATGLPAGLGMDAAGNIYVLDGTDRIPNDSALEGSYTVTVTANDGHGATVSQAFTFDLTNPAPTAVNDDAATTEDSPIDIDVLGNDTDPDRDTLVVDPASPPQAGNGKATINPDGTLHYVPNVDFAGTDTVVYRVSDGQGGASTGVVNVTVSEVNDPPRATQLPDIQRNDGDAVNFDLRGYFTDPENQPLAYAVTGLPAGLDYDAASHTISGRIAADACGPSGLADYQVTVTASDGYGGAASVTFKYTIRNLAPVAENDTASTDEDTPVDIAVLENDSDPDGDIRNIIRVNGVSLGLDGATASTTNGSVQLIMEKGEQVLRFTPKPDFIGIEFFAYSLDDGNSGIDTATVTIAVGPVNDMPVGTPIPDADGRDGADVAIDLTRFFSDVDGDTLRYAVTGLPPGLSIDPTTGSITGTLASDASGQGGLAIYRPTVTASDGNGGAATTSFAFTVRNVVPVAEDDTATTKEDTPVNIAMLSNDSDTDRDTSAIIRVDGIDLSVDGPSVLTANGSVQLVSADGQRVLRFTPDANFTGTEALTYSIDDGNSGIDTATVTISVLPVNDAPVATAIPDTDGLDGSPVNLDVSGFFSDVDDDALHYSAIGLPPGLAIDADTGQISGKLTPDASQGGPYRTTISVNDGSGGTVSTTFVIGVANPSPKAADDVAITAEDTAVTVDVLTNDIDPDFDPLTIDAIDGQPIPAGETVAVANGTIRLNADETLTFTPSPDFNGTSVVSYRLTDGNGGFSDASATFKVDPVNDVPTIDLNASSQGLGNAAGFREGDTASAIANRDAIVFDVEDRITRLAVTLTGFVDGNSEIVHLGDDVDIVAGVPSSGTTAFDGTQVAFIYDGIASLQLTHADGRDRPIPSDVLNVLLRSLRYENNSQIPTDGDRRFSFTVTDIDDATSAPALAIISVVGDNDAPVGVDSSVTTDEDVSLAGTVAATDVDGDVATFEAITMPSHGSVALSRDGRYTYTPNADFHGADSFVVRAADGRGGVAVLTVTVDVKPTNDTPVGRDFAVSTNEDTALTGTVVATDVDGDVPTFRVLDQPANGIVSVASNGGYSYTPSADFHGVDSFIVQVDDGQGGVTRLTVTVDVKPVNDAPVATEARVSTKEDTGVTGHVVATDADGDLPTFRVAYQPANGRATITPNGQYSYTPTANFHGTESFNVALDDGKGGVTKRLSR
jgi:VCBS repeat-containing protein